MTALGNEFREEALNRIAQITIQAMSSAPTIFEEVLKKLPDAQAGLVEKYMIAAACFSHLEFQIYRMLNQAGLPVEALDAFRFSVLSTVLGCEYGLNPDSRTIIEMLYGERENSKLSDILEHIDNNRGKVENNPEALTKDDNIAKVVKGFQETFSAYLKDKEKRRS